MSNDKAHTADYAELLALASLGRAAIGEHNAPQDCYSTGPLTGNPFMDLVACPACAFIEAHHRALAKASVRQT